MSAERTLKITAFGERIHVLKDPWISQLQNNLPQLKEDATGGIPSKLSDLILKNPTRWKESLIRDKFSEVSANQILNTFFPGDEFTTEDKLTGLLC